MRAQPLQPLEVLVGRRNGQVGSRSCLRHQLRPGGCQPSQRRLRFLIERGIHQRPHLIIGESALHHRVPASRVGTDGDVEPAEANERRLPKLPSSLNFAQPGLPPKQFR